MDLKIIQQEYDYLEGRAYLDWSTMGLPPRRSLEAARTYLDDFAFHLAQPSLGSHEERRALCKQRLGRLIHADPSDIFFTDNTTQGNNLLASGLALQPGDEVLLGNGDFTSVWMPWTRRQRDGIELVWVPNENGVVAAEDFIARMTPRTRVVAISWVQSESGYVTDLELLGRACRDRGILLSVDGIQGMGRLPMDVERLHIDVLSSGSFKGMLGVMGAGFCYCRREVMHRIDPPMCSGNIDFASFPVSPGFTELGIPTFAEGAARMETGTCNNYGYIVMSESVQLLLDLGAEEIARQIRALETYLRQRLREADLDIALKGSEDPATWGGSVSFWYPPAYKAELETKLAERDITVAVRGYLRISLHVCNTEAHIDRLMDVLTQVLPKR